MMNFLFGTVAGGMIVGVVTIVAVRNPDIQSRLGLFPVALAAPAKPAVPPEPACPPPATTAAVGTQEMLLSKRRFWLVAP